MNHTRGTENRASALSYHSCILDIDYSLASRLGPPRILAGSGSGTRLGRSVSAIAPSTRLYQDRIELNQLCHHDGIGMRMGTAGCDHKAARVDHSQCRLCQGRIAGRSKSAGIKKWSRGESNPRPGTVRSAPLRVCSIICFRPHGRGSTPSRAANPPADPRPRARGRHL